MKTLHNLAALPWELSGWTPNVWRLEARVVPDGIKTGPRGIAEITAIPGSVPGSVQKALLNAGLLPDWNVGLNARACEWAENRQWLFETRIPSEWRTPGARVRLNALGLDYSGWVLVNGKEAGAFTGAFVPHTFDLTPHLSDGENRLQIVFDLPPRYLGQIGYTSRMTLWKPRYNYTWDWNVRTVQTGVWDAITLETLDGPEMGDLRIQTGVDLQQGHGSLQVRRTSTDAPDGFSARVTLEQGGETLRTDTVPLARLNAGLEWAALPVEPWWPNGEGTQPLYALRVELVDNEGTVHDADTRQVGFKKIEWLPCEGAPPDADPWICAVNGRPVFLQGVNWTPILPNFADVTPEDIRKRLDVYRDMGVNTLRVWGGATLETETFYNLCDAMGFLVWQEFPLSSSGVENWPPEDATAIEELAVIAASYVQRRRHHVSLLLWCGGNELQGALDGGKEGTGKPCDITHPLLKRFGDIVAAEDPSRRYLPTSSSGPRFGAEETDFGKDLHWDVHGPWNVSGTVEGDWARYWEHDDALFRSETGVPSASPVDVLMETAGDLAPWPPTRENPLWRRTSWWIDGPQFFKEHGDGPHTLEQYVAWSQKRQADALRIAARACKGRFPRCGGFLVWMGHDSFPCAANTAILDVHGRPKPAALALGDVFRERPSP